MRLAVLGGATKAGQRFISQALDHGYSVTSLLESSATLPIQHQNLHIVRGLLHCTADVMQVLKHCHAVIGLPGTNYETAAIHTITSCMYALGLRRIVLSTNDLGHLQQSHARSGIVGLLNDAALDWTVVHSMSHGTAVASAEPSPELRVSSNDVTKFLIGQITDVKHLRSAVLLSN